MKRLVLALLLLFPALTVWSQDRVVLLRDTTRLGISVAELEQKYPPALDRIATRQGVTSRETGAVGTKAKPFYDSLSANFGRFYRFMEQQKRRIPIVGIVVNTQEFIGPDGTYDRVLCEFTTDTLTTDQEITYLQLLAEWYGQHPFPYRTKTGFRQTNIRQIGSPGQKRMVRRGPGLISTLEAARKTTRPDTVIMLSLNQLELSAIPEVVYRFPRLEELDLSKNNLHELPARLTADIPTLKRLSLLFNVIPDDSVFITRNKHLLSLNLQGNKLTRVPPTVRQNRHLESLWLGNNALKQLDIKTLRKVRRLTDLNLYNAGLTQLPRGIGRLKRVKVLDLYYNKFDELPRQLGRMKRLEQLALANNNLSELPASLAKLRRLQLLYVHHNRISQLPESFRKLQNLRVLDLGYNWFTVTPAVLAMLPALQELDMNNNNLQEFSDVFGRIPNLKKVYLGTNPMFGPEAMSSPYARQIEALKANNREVFY